VRRRWLLVPILLLVSPPAISVDSQADSSQRLEQVRGRISELQREMEGAKGQYGELTRRLQQSEQEIGRVSLRLQSLDDQLANQRRRIAALREEEATATAALVEQRTALARQVRAAYVIGRQERLRLLLNQEDPASLSRVLVYFDYLNRARAERMATIQKYLAASKRFRRDIVSEEQRLQALLAEEQANLSELEARQQDRLAVVRDLGERLEDQGRQLERLRRDEGRLQFLIEQIERALSDIPLELPGQELFSQRKGELGWPTKGRLAATFGAPKAGSLRWDGVLIDAAEGDEVRAVHYGRVAFADWLRGFGLLLIVDHGDGWMSLYGHNRSLFKDVGDWVQANEAVATVGNSGGRIEPGVYFGIRHKGVAVDPQRWCRRPRGRRVG
jgi:septal ring factor EnvC (AmiA/AmiB activator)